MNCVIELERLGFRLDVDAEGHILYEYAGDGKAVPKATGPLLADLKEHRDEAVQYLRERGEPWSSPFALPPDPPDPRPDLVEDSPAWQRLLAMAWPIDGNEPEGLYGALAGLRYCGCQLVRDNGRWVLRAGQMEAEEYAAAREQYLRPHGDLLITLLRALEKEPRQPAAPAPEPEERCPVCGGRYRVKPGGDEVCSVCHPDPRDTRDGT